MAAAREDYYTQTGVQPVFYSDFPMNLDLNPVTGALVRVTNEESVRGSLKRLVLIARESVPHKLSVGSKIGSLLFDMVDDITTSQLETTITQSIINNEPRVTLLGLSVIDLSDQNAYRVDITFSMNNVTTDPMSFSVLLKRVR